MSTNNVTGTEKVLSYSYPVKVLTTQEVSAIVESRMKMFYKGKQAELIEKFKGVLTCGLITPKNYKKTMDMLPEEPTQNDNEEFENFINQIWKDGFQKYKHVSHDQLKNKINTMYVNKLISRKRKDKLLSLLMDYNDKLRVIEFLEEQGVSFE